jgi:DNA-binding NarL/FixJ family response regulator
LKRRSMDETPSSPHVASLLQGGGVPMAPDDTARIWRELALGEWQVLAARDAEGTRRVVIAPLPKRSIPWEELTCRERRVVGVAAQGASQKIIAAELGLKASAVSEALRTARTRLGFATVAQLLRAYDAAVARRG